MCVGGFAIGSLFSLTLERTDTTQFLRRFRLCINKVAVQNVQQSFTLGLARAQQFASGIRHGLRAKCGLVPEAVLMDAGDLRHLDRTRSEEHTSVLQSLMRISYAVF